MSNCCGPLSGVVIEIRNVGSFGSKGSTKIMARSFDCRVRVRGF